MKENKFILSAFTDEAGDGLCVQLDAMERNGIYGMEIRGIDGENIAALSIDKVREVKAALDSRGLRVINLGSPVGKISVTDDFATHLASFERLLESAHILGAERMRIFSFYLPDDKRDVYRDEVMERLGRLVEAAKGSGVMLCHENERGIYGENAEQCLDIMKAQPQIRSVFDPANFVLCGQQIRSAWELLAPYVEYLHIKDALPEGRIVPAGQGMGKIPYLLERFASQGGKHITLEPHLFEFTGLAGLEMEDSQLQVGGIYATQEESFDAAVAALKKIINEME